MTQTKNGTSEDKQLQVFEAELDAERLKQSDLITKIITVAEKNKLLAMQMFQQELDKPCPKQFIRKEQGYDTLPISYVESMLNAYFLGEWDAENLKWERMGNEICGSLDVVYVNPVTGNTRRKTGAAAIQIMCDALSKEDRNAMSRQEINAHYLNPENKKPNALETGFPKFKAMCIKNAAKEIGKRFGGDLNRKHVADSFGIIRDEQIEKLLTEEPEEK